MSAENNSALHPDEWALWRTGDGTLRHMLLDGWWHEREYAKMLAAIASLLPDDDPRKLVAEDVRLLRHAAQMARDGKPLDPALFLDYLADKLAALLPPEPETR